MSCEHDMANDTCSICDPYVVQNVRDQLTRAEKALTKIAEDHIDKKCECPACQYCDVMLTQSVQWNLCHHDVLKQCADEEKT